MSDLAKAILKQPYTVVLVPSEEGGVTAKVLEFPGCLAEGETAEEAIANLREAAISWIDAAMEQGQEIPAPRSETQSNWG